RERNAIGWRNVKNRARESIIGRCDFDVIHDGRLILGQVRNLDVRNLGWRGRCREFDLVLQESRRRGSGASTSAGIAVSLPVPARAQPRPRTPVALGSIEISTTREYLDVSFAAVADPSPIRERIGVQNFAFKRSGFF